MQCIVYSRGEEISRNLGERVVELLQAEGAETVNGRKKFVGDNFVVVESEHLPIHEEGIDSVVDADLFIFLSRHKSGKGIPSFTVHPLGNWSADAEIGGKPRELGIAAPWQMRDILMRIKEKNDTPVLVTYEATHHGPLLRKPALFVEVGGSEGIGRRHYDILAEAVADHVSKGFESNGVVAIGIGGTHYPERFTRLALEDKYAFTHIMPKYYCKETEMLSQAVTRSDPVARCAVLDWKGIGSAEERSGILSKLEELGIEYVRI